LSQRLERLVARDDAALLLSARRDRKLRGGVVPMAVERVLADALTPAQVVCSQSWARLCRGHIREISAGKDTRIGKYSLRELLEPKPCLEE
jgi:hypothetical protein